MDPSRHWIGHVPLDGPKPLDDFVAQARPALAAGAAIDGRAPGSRDIVAISTQRAGVIATLLEELAARLRPGVASGPIRSDGDLARLTHELAEDMYRRSA